MRCRVRRTWRTDLEAAHRDERRFPRLLQHRGIVLRLVKPMYARYRYCSFLAESDLEQEAWLAVISSLRTWKPELNPNIAAWVEYSIRRRLQRRAADYRQTIARDLRLLDSMVADERVIYRFESDSVECDLLAPAVVPAEDFEKRADAESMLKLICSQLSQRQASIVTAVFSGVSIRVAAELVYGADCKHPKKAAARAIAAAHAVVKVSTAQEENYFKHGPTDHEKRSG